MLPTDDAIFSILRNKNQTIFDSLNILYSLSIWSIDGQYYFAIWILHNNTDRLGASLISCLENVLCIARRMPHQYTTDHKSCLTQKLPIIRHRIICQILLTVMKASCCVFVGGGGGKAHACHITRCIARDYDAFFSNLELLCNVHIYSVCW